MNLAITRKLNSDEGRTQTIPDVSNNFSPFLIHHAEKRARRPCCCSSLLLLSSDWGLLDTIIFENRAKDRSNKDKTTSISFSTAVCRLTDDENKKGRGNQTGRQGERNCAVGSKWIDGSCIGTIPIDWSAHHPDSECRTRRLCSSKTGSFRPGP